MPGKTLPTILSSDVASRNTAESCYVTRGAKVYDITSFLDDHPGGADLILDYGGKDVCEIMGDELSHAHSEAAFEILEEHLIGFVANDAVLKTASESQSPGPVGPLPRDGAGLEEIKANGTAAGSAKATYATTGMSCAEDLSVETDRATDYQTHKFLDLDRPLFMQIWNGGFSKKFYLEQVHRPRHYKGGESAPLFGNFLEPLSKTPWWVVPTVWLPPVAYGTFLGWRNLDNTPLMIAYWFLGLFLWTLVEYILHRGLFHIDRWAIPLDSDQGSKG
jgi:4-hydroxysphinganine ceramide fatty acyl 2-hydroxylase